jgi:hypothetical protein
LPPQQDLWVAQMPKAAQVSEGEYINMIQKRQLSEVEISACAFSAQMTVHIGSQRHLVSLLTDKFC